MSTRIITRTLGTTVLLGAGFAIVLGASALSARQATKPAAAAQKMDDEYTKKIIDLTPDKRILTELIDHMPMPADPKVPSPLKMLGYIPGEGGKLTYSKDVYAYLDALDAGSFSYAWRHPDRRVDSLQAEVSRLVEEAARTGEDTRQTFERIQALAHRQAGLAPPTALPATAARSKPPRLTESWFC